MHLMSHGRCLTLCIMVRMLIVPLCILLEVPSADEAEVYQILQECLELRESYVFREEVAPWEKEVITDPSTPKPNPTPFAYAAEQKTDVSSIFIFFCYTFFALHNVGMILLLLFFLGANFLFFLFHQHYFQMEDGVVHVYANKDCKNASIICFLVLDGFIRSHIVF